jgi:hypothetical protein
MRSTQPMLCSLPGLLVSYQALALSTDARVGAAAEMATFVAGPPRLPPLASVRMPAGGRGAKELLSRVFLGDGRREASCPRPGRGRAAGALR